MREGSAVAPSPRVCVTCPRRVRRGPSGPGIGTETTRGPLSPRRHRRDAYERTPLSDHVHELHLTYISSGAISSTFQRRFMFSFESLLDAQVVLDEVVEVVLVK